MYIRLRSYFEFLQRWSRVFRVEDVATYPPPWFLRPRAFMRRMGLKRLAYSMLTEAPSHFTVEFLRRRFRCSASTIRRDLRLARREWPNLETQVLRDLVTPRLLKAGREVNLWRNPIDRNIDWVLAQAEQPE